MKKEKREIQVITPNEIINLFYEGLSIKMLTDRVAFSEQTTKKLAKEKVELAIYTHQTSKSIRRL